MSELLVLEPDTSTPSWHDPIFRPAKLRPATPEEIKEAHGKCVTCKYCSVDAELCYHPCHTDEDDCPKNVLPDFDYCNHHEPKET